jgi:hypothetical protein
MPLDYTSAVDEEISVFDPRTGLKIVPSRDYKITDFARKLLTEFYLSKNETIQEGYARASRAWCGGDISLAQRLYDAVSKGWFMFASPVLSNAPLPEKTAKGLPASCFIGETLVMTTAGFKRIEDLVIGDKVLSDDNSFNEIEAIRDQISTDLYEISVNDEIITTTGNHLFMTKDHGWIRVDQLDSEIHELVSIV